MIPLEPDEKIIFTIQKHWIVYGLEAFLMIGLVIIPIVFLSYLINLSFVQLSGDHFFLFIFCSSLWFLFCWVIFFIVWTNNYLDELVITDKRVIDIEQISLFSREISSFPLDKIQDITIEINGFLPTMMHYGDIIIETAAEDEQARMNTVPNPEKIKNDILALHHKASDSQGSTLG